MGWGSITRLLHCYTQHCLHLIPRAQHRVGLLILSLFTRKISKVLHTGSREFQFHCVSPAVLGLHSCSTSPQCAYQAGVAASSPEFQVTYGQWHSLLIYWYHKYIHLPRLGTADLFTTHPGLSKEGTIFKVPHSAPWVKKSAVWWRVVTIASSRDWLLGYNLLTDCGKLTQYIHAQDIEAISGSCHPVTLRNQNLFDLKELRNSSFTPPISSGPWFQRILWLEGVAWHWAGPKDHVEWLSWGKCFLSLLTRSDRSLKGHANRWGCILSVIRGRTMWNTTLNVQCTAGKSSDGCSPQITLTFTILSLLHLCGKVYVSIAWNWGMGTYLLCKEMALSFFTLCVHCNRIPHVGWCAQACGGQSLTLEIILNHSFTIFIEIDRAPSSLEVTRTASLPSQPALKILRAGHHAQLDLCGFQESKLQSSPLHLNTWASSPVWILIPFMMEETLST